MHVMQRRRKRADRGGAANIISGVVRISMLINYIAMQLEQIHANNFGATRLILALLVIVSHSPELIDGDRSREIATSIWHTLSFGEIAVDGFFIVSGYLITQSFQNSRGPLSYLRKRVLRIYPAFVVAFALCIFVIAPLTSDTRPPLLDNALRVVLLQPPEAPGVFGGLPHPILNGAMWSIAYEFRCYLLVLALGALGLLQWRAAIALTGVAFLLLTGFQLVPAWVVPYDSYGIFGFLPLDIRMAGTFLLGMSFYLYRDRIAFSGRGALVVAIPLFGLMYLPQVAELVFATLGGYLLLWFALSVPSLPIARRTDISYGLYLYAWPIGSLIIWYLGPDISPWLLMLATALIAGALGAASWFLFERPALRFKEPVSRKADDATPIKVASTPPYGDR